MLFTRRIDFTVQPGQGGEFLERYRAAVADLLQDHEGFETHMVLSEGNSYTTLTFWRDQASAQVFAERGFARLLVRLKSVLSGKPEVRSMMLLEGAVPSDDVVGSVAR